MAKSVRLDSEFVLLAKVYASASKRSVSEQIEHWAQIGKIAEENPDLPYSFIRDAFIATAEMEAGLIAPYEPRKNRNIRSSN